MITCKRCGQTTTGWCPECSGDAATIRAEDRKNVLKDVETALRQRCMFAGSAPSPHDIRWEVPGLKTAIRLVKEMADDKKKEGADL